MTPDPKETTKKMEKEKEPLPPAPVGEIDPTDLIRSRALMALQELGIQVNGLLKKRAETVGRAPTISDWNEIAAWIEHYRGQWQDGRLTRDRAAGLLYTAIRNAEPAPLPAEEAPTWADFAEEEPVAEPAPAPEPVAVAAPEPQPIDEGGRDWWAGRLGILELLALQLPESTFEAWLVGSTGRVEGDRLVVTLPSQRAVEFCRQRLNRQIGMAARSTLGRPVEIVYAAVERERVAA